MFRFGGSRQTRQRITSTVMWAALASAMTLASSHAAEPARNASRIDESVKVRRQLRAAERSSMLPRAPRVVAPASRSAVPAPIAASAAPAVAPASTPNTVRPTETAGTPRESANDSAKPVEKEAAKVDGAHAARPNANACVVTGRALLGEPQLASFAQRIGEVDVERCFDAIPAMKTIKQEELRPTRARYHFLMRQANVDLQRAIAAAASRRGVTLVVERGGVQNAGEKSIDLTQSVLDALQSPSAP